jgi:hypothetical protein
LQLDHRLGVALAGLLRQAGRQIKQLEQGAQHRKVDLFRCLDVLELFELFDRAFRELHQLAGVDLVAGDRHHQVAGIDQATQHRDQQIRLQAVLDGREILDVRGAREQFAAVEHLAVALGLEPGQHLQRVAGLGRVHPVAIEKLQRIQHSDGVLGAGATGESTQCIANELFAVGFGDQHREGGVFG